jgi:hydroxypyruvate isomerase
MKRREFLSAAAAAGLGALLPGCATAQGQAEPIVRKGRIKQGLWQINFGQNNAPAGAQGAPDRPPSMTFDQMCAYAVQIGVKGWDLIQPPQWPTAREHGLEVIIAGPGGIDFLTGLVHPEVHDSMVEVWNPWVDQLADNNVRRFAANAGQLRGLTYAQAADNAVELLNRMKEKFEERNVTICIENVNDRRPNDPGLGRTDMAFGHWDWGVEVCQRVNSPNVKLLCDLYHLQIMDGDLAWRIRESQQWIGHFHVAGVPTRTEIDGTQEVNWRYIAEVIAELDYDGYLSHEWRPRPGNDPLESIAAAVALMDV